MGSRSSRPSGTDRVAPHGGLGRTLIICEPPSEIQFVVNPTGRVVLVGQTLSHARFNLITQCIALSHSNGKIILFAFGISVNIRSFVRTCDRDTNKNDLFGLILYYRPTTNYLRGCQCHCDNTMIIHRRSTIVQ